MVTFRVCLILLALVIGWNGVSASAQDTKKAHRSWREDLLALHNARRHKENLPPLKLNPLLTQAAQKHSLHMAKTEKFAHEGIGDGTIRSRIEETGYEWGRIGENILHGAKDIKVAMQTWVDSPPHLANIVRPDYTEVGFGFVKSASGKQYWTACFGKPLRPAADGE